MGRASLGPAAKTKTGSVRVTAAQDHYFETHFGGLGKFLQLKVAEQFAAAQRHNPATCNPVTGEHVTPHVGCILR